MRKLISCEFNFDTVCVELKFSDGSMIAINTIAVENEITADLSWCMVLLLLAQTRENARFLSAIIWLVKSMLSLMLQIVALP